MKKIFAPLMISTALFVTAYSNYGYSNEGGHHDAEAKSSHHDTISQPSHHGGPKKHHQNMMGHEHAMGTMTGAPGKEADVSRTITITADDTMRFMHEPLNIKEGETIKFIVTNKGAIVHEFAIATKDEHMEHGQMMMKNPTMHHAPGGNVVSIKPGETEALIWKFDNAWQIEAACNIPGHYEAGMHSPVNIKGK